MISSTVRARVRSLPGVAWFRRSIEHLLAPNLRADVAAAKEELRRLEIAREQLREDFDRLAGIVDRLSRRLDDTSERIAAIEHESRAVRTSNQQLMEQVGPLLDSVLSTNEIARLARREMDQLRKLVAAHSPSSSAIRK